MAILPPGGRWDNSRTTPIRSARSRMPTACSRSNSESTSCAPHPQRPAAPSMITQRELLQLGRCRQCERLRERLQASVIDRLRRGAEIEPGTLTARIATHQQIRASWEALAALLGDEAVAELRTHVNPTECTRLFIEFDVDYGPV